MNTTAKIIHSMNDTVSPRSRFVFSISDAIFIPPWPQPARGIEHLGYAYVHSIHP